jgi:hypothetical protein
MAGVAASFVSERLAAHVNAFAALVAEAMSGLSHIVASFPWADFEVAPWPVHVCVEWYVAMALALWLLGSVLRRRREAGCRSAKAAKSQPSRFFALVRRLIIWYNILPISKGKRKKA